MKLLFATHNQGKLKEARSLLAGLDLEVLSISQANRYSNLNLNELDVAETKDTFQSNALLKARAFAEASLLVTAADDSGLELNALGGFPGIRSARWLEGSDKERNLGLLKKLEDQGDRSAKFVAVVCVSDPRKDSRKGQDQQNSSHCFKGEVLGTIADQLQGEKGFGYDSIFIPEGETLTFAQLGVEAKNQQSHRRLALKQLKKYLQDEYGV